MARPSVRVLIVWRHRVLGEAVARSLRGRPEVTVAGVADGVTEALRILGSQAVDVGLIDASVDLKVSLELVARLREEHPHLAILPFGVPSDRVAVALIEAGSSGFLSDQATLDELVEAIVGPHPVRRPARLDLVARVAARIEELSGRDGSRNGAAVRRLSDRELEVLTLLARGLGNKEIAHGLDVRLSTVKNHVHSILRKLDADGRREAVRIAYEDDILRGPLRWRPIEEDP